MAASGEDVAWQEGVSTPCALCDKEEDVNSFCKDCHQYLCDTCKRLHLRSTSCINHKIVPKVEGYKLRQVKNVICNDHNAPFAVFCRPCGRHICTECLTSGQHNGHKFSNIDAYAKELNDILQKQIKDKENEESNALKKMSEYSKACHEEISKCDDTISKVKAKVAGLIADAKKVEREMIQKLSERKSYLMDTENKNLQQMQSAVTESKQKITKLERERQGQSSISVVEFMGTAQQILTSINVPKIQSYSLMSHDFKQGSTNFDQLRSMIGNLQMHVKDEVHSSVSHNKDSALVPQAPEVALHVKLSDQLIVQNLTTLYLKVLSLCIVEHDKLCVGVYGSPQNQLLILSHDGHIIQQYTFTGGFTPFPLAQVDDENILVSSYKTELILWNFKSHNRISTLYVTSKYVTSKLGGAVLTEGGYLVAEGSSPQQSFIHHINKEGQIIDFLKLSKCLKSEDVGIVRRIVPYKRNVYLLLIKDKIFQMDGNFITLAVTLDKSWKITRIAGDKFGHIIGSSESDIFVFNAHGVLLKQYKVPLENTDKITCIAEGSYNHLMVGTLRGYVKIVLYIK